MSVGIRRIVNANLDIAEKLYSVSSLCFITMLSVLYIGTDKHNLAGGAVLPWVILRLGMLVIRPNEFQPENQTCLRIGDSKSPHFAY